MNDFQEFVIGFDARENYIPMSHIWDNDRINRYLLSSTLHIRRRKKAG